jgi:branched-chain amino acid transport system ATP-binding protein
MGEVGAMTTPLLAVERLFKNYGGLPVTSDVSLEIVEGELHALIGPNGAGKTTLMAQITGELAPSSGTIRFDGEDITRLPMHRRVARGLGRSFQISSVFGQFTVEGNVALAVQVAQGHGFRFWKRVDRLAAVREPARALLDRVGLTGRNDVTAAELAHGELRLLELAMVLAAAPRLLLLDEPLAGLGTAESTQMIGVLAELKKRHTILLIEHDMTAVFSLAERISVLAGGRLIATAAPEVIRGDAAVRTAYLGNAKI